MMLNKNTSNKKKYIIICVIVVIVGIVVYGVYKHKKSETLELPPYTEEYKGEANLVDVEGFMFSELYNSSKDKTYYRFKINQDNKESVDIEVTDLDCTTNYADNTDVDYKDKLGKVYFFERTYKLSDSETIKRNVYKVYVLKDKVKEVSIND
ncbi:hypothetical protein [Clostridium cibarium]|uniref:Lipoprotein n=1 Tax=Clostridium cibarium TaxID=2762247 RepID=A0ABR8PSL5_9CLOT|nr:hypothetical protein [Clostridium cibarium]MBD7911138.1 hypothetical protein [Clostridium cibarium]